MAALTVYSTARVSFRGKISPRYRWDPFRIRWNRRETRSPALEAYLIKVWKAEKISFSRPSALEALIPRKTLGWWSHGRAITSSSRAQQDRQQLIYLKLIASSYFNLYFSFIFAKSHGPISGLILWNYFLDLKSNQWIHWFKQRHCVCRFVDKCFETLTEYVWVVIDKALIHSYS